MARTGRILPRDRIRAIYDRLGSLLDTQGFYENVALDAVVRHGRFDAAHAIFELGCGTGRLAERLLSTVLPPTCTYRGTDVSTTMIDLATRRLQRWAPRATLRLSDGSLRFPELDRSFDRFVSTYVVDLLGAADIEAVLEEAHRLLVPGGLLCVVNLTGGRTRLSRAVSAAWTAVNLACPAVLGGCRPLSLREHVSDDRWTIEHSEIVSTFGVASEVTVAARRPAASCRTG